MNASGRRGVHTGDKYMPGPVDVWLAGQLLFGQTCLASAMKEILDGWKSVRDRVHALCLK